jgi:archaellum component FlaC
MTAEIENLVLEHLRAIRAKQDQHSERLDRIDLRLSVIEQTVGSLFAMAGSDRETMQTLTKRVERIERRLELAEG